MSHFPLVNPWPEEELTRWGHMACRGGKGWDLKWPDLELQDIQTQGEVGMDEVRENQLNAYRARVVELSERNQALCARNKRLLDEGQTLMNALSVFADSRNWIHQPADADDDVDGDWGYWEFVLSPRDITPWQYCQDVIDSLKNPTVQEDSDSE